MSQHQAPNWNAAPQRKKGHPVLITLGIVLLLVCGIGGVVALANGGGDDPEASAVLTDPETTAPARSAAPATRAPASKAPAKPALTDKGTGRKKTAKFKTDDDWKLAYTFDCSGIGGKGNFQVYLYTDGGLSDVLVNELAAKGSSSTPVYDDGEHYLDINTGCKWTVKVTG